MYELGALSGKQDESSVSYSVPLQAALLTFSNCGKVGPGDGIGKARVGLEPGTECFGSRSQYVGACDS